MRQIDCAARRIDLFAGRTLPATSKRSGPHQVVAQRDGNCTNIEIGSTVDGQLSGTLNPRNRWGRFGLVDSFCENGNWYSRTYLAINQGPIIAMVENHRTGSLWVCLWAHRKYIGASPSLVSPARISAAIWQMLAEP